MGAITGTMSATFVAEHKEACTAYLEEVRDVALVLKEQMGFQGTVGLAVFNNTASLSFNLYKVAPDPNAHDPPPG